MIGRYEHLPALCRELLAEARRIGEELASLAGDGEPRCVNRPLVGALATRGLLGPLFDRAVDAGAARQMSALEGLNREVRAPRIHESASQVQREIIARRRCGQ